MPPQKSVDFNNVDTQALNLTRAIGLQEGGGTMQYTNTSGDNGTSKGAYQWQPGNFESAAKTYGLDPNDFSSTNQDKVAYAQVKTWKDQGLQPAEIAAKWNSGNEHNWQNHSGDTVINGKTIHYDTPAYVQNVKNYYDKLAGSNSQPQAPITPVEQAPAPDDTATAGNGILAKAGAAYAPAAVDVGQALAKGGNEDLYTQATQQTNDTISRLQQTIATKKAAGGDTSKLEAALTQLQADMPKEADFTGNQKTAEQVAGDIGTTALNVAGTVDLAGAIPGNAILGSAEAAAPAATTAGERIINAGVTSAKYGTAYGVAGAAQQNASLEELAKQGIISGGKWAITGGILGTAGEGIKSVIGKATTPVEQVMENIAPKETAAEARLAMKQGRIIGAKEPGLFTAGSPGEIIPTEKVQQAAQTIVDQIPGASKMDQPTLFKALDTNIGKISTDLRPEMEKVTIPQDSLDKITTDWESLKVKQFEDASATDEPNVIKIQKQFQKVIDSIKPDTSLDKVWDARIDYDNSVPNNVKKANSLSSDWLNTQRSIWLKNREILNNVINDSATGLGTKSQKAFSDMSDMYTAQNGLLTKAKATITAKPSKLAAWISRNPIKSGIAGIAIGSQLGKAGSVIKAVSGL